MKKLAVILLALSLTGCAARPIHPGAANKFDSDAYDTLLVQKNVIDNTRADLSNGTFTGPLAVNIKNALNALIAAYNAEDTAYQLYHTAALTGTDTSNLQADLTMKQAAANASVQNLTQAKVTKP